MDNIVIGSKDSIMPKHNINGQLLKESLSFFKLILEFDYLFDLAIETDFLS